MKYTLVLMVGLVLSGCATASKPGAMVAPVTEETLIEDGSPLNAAFSVGSVSGGQETNPLWTSEVSNEDFAEALRQSFAAHAMLATDAGQYRLDATLEKLKQPFAGLNLTVVSDVNYVLTDIATGDAVFERTITQEYTAGVGEAFMAVERLRLANEGSIKGNISQLIEALVNHFEGEEAPPSGNKPSEPPSVPSS